jgi:PAS domain S-box-containing protein
MTIRGALSCLRAFLLGPDPPGNEETHRRAELLRYLTNGILVLALLAILVGVLFIYPRRAGSLASLTAVVLVILASRYLLKRGVVNRASALLLSGLWVIILFVIVAGNGLADANVPLVLTLIVLAGLLLGHRQALVMAAATILFFLVLLLLRDAAVLPLHYFPQPPLTRWVQLVITILMTVIILNEALRSLDESLRSARRESGERQKALDALRESRELFTKTVNTIPDIVVRLGQDGRIEFINDHALDISGYSREEVVGADMLAFIAPEDRERASLNAVRMFETQLGPIEYDFLLKDGRRLPVEVNGDLLRRDDGAPFGAVFVCRDVMERRMAGSALRESEERYRQLVEESLQGQFVIQDDRIIFANRALADISGYSLEEILSWSAGDFWNTVHPDDRALVGDRLQARLAGEPAPNRYECRCIRKDEVVRWAEVRGSRIVYRGRPAIQALILDVDDRKQAELALRESEERFSAAFHASPVPTVLSTVGEGRCLIVNDQWCRLIGYTREELVGRTSRELSIWSRQDERDDLITKYLQTGTCRDELVHLRTKSGEIREVLVSSELVRQEGDWVVLSLLQDVTERKRVERALLASEQRYRTILEEIEEGYEEVDLEGNFTFFNEPFQRIFGYSREDLLGSNFRRFAADEENAREVLRVYRGMFRTGIPIQRHAWDILNRDGQRRTIEYSASILRDADGRPTGSRGIVRDVTDRRQAEEQYRVMANNSQSGIYITVRGRFRFVNPHVVAYSEYPEQELLGEPSLRFVHPEDRAVAAEQVRKMLAGEMRSPHEYRIVTKSGKVRWLLGSVTWITYQGERAVLGDTMDITELKEAREQLESMQEQLQQAQKLESLGTLAGGIAHDFNNLLMGIQGYASLMLLGMGEGHPHYEKLKAIESQVQSGSELTRQLLGFARGGRYEVKPTDLGAILGKTALMFGRTKKEIRIHEKYEEMSWSVEADRGQIEQVFLNLLVNAWQAMPGGGDLFLETANVVLDREDGLSHSVSPGRYVRVSVTDTGVGMDERTRQRIFDPFFTTKKMGRGAGLGLASVYGIVKGHGGFIRVASEPGRGASFTIHFPASDKPLEEEPAPRPEMDGGQETILVADDEDLVRDVTREMLESLGYRVLTARDGEEALALYRSEESRIDLVILDLIMPGMGGGEVYDALRVHDPTVRVILSSGYSLDGKARQIMKRGIREFIQKPFRFEDLARKIRAVLAD